MIRLRFAIVLPLAVAAGCASGPRVAGTLAELDRMPADVDEVYLADSLERAAQSYRNYLNETPKGELTPEAMRRLADLQLEREYGVIAAPPPAQREAAELDAHETMSIASAFEPTLGGAKAVKPAGGESDADFEQRASDMSSELLSRTDEQSLAPAGVEESVPTGPLEALRTYQKILDTYPNYERNDQVLYQMSRAYDELGRTEEAMDVMARLVTRFPYSRYTDEVRFRRGEYFFVRKKYLDAEDEYQAIIDMGPGSSYHELALYKMGWTLYKQELYEDALHRFLAVLDYRQSIGYDFGETTIALTEEDEESEGDEHRIRDTFRVISLSFSNLGGATVLNDYFAQHGHRSFADKIYSNLAEFYFAKLRYDDAATVYRSFVELNPLHRASPHFGMRVIDVYDAGGFPKLVVESKKQFATDYAIDAPYWSHNDIDGAPEVVGFLKTNLTDLANHYHALFQEEALFDERDASFAEAQRWYRQFLGSFPNDAETPPIHYQLADLLLENEDYEGAAFEYERTAYDYGEHEKASAAGYAAVFAWREELKGAEGSRMVDVRQSTVASSLRFADTYPAHEKAVNVLGAAADDLYDMQDYALAIESAHKLIERYPGSDAPLRLSAWAVIAHSSIDIEAYRDAELAYIEVLALTPEDDESRPAVIDGLAASIYKQGEEASAAEDHLAAADHFLRIRDVAPESLIRQSAEYDAAAALMKLENWGRAAGVLEDFRAAFPEHELNKEATKQLAHVYREDGQLDRSAAEHVRIADEATDPELAREALLTAGDMYDEIRDVERTIEVYERYVETYPRPLDIMLETRTRLSELFRDQSDFVRYHDELRTIVEADAAAGADRSDRSRFLAANAALVLAELSFERFAGLELTLPFEDSLAEKQRRMDVALAELEALVDYRVANVTAAATFYIAETYRNFSASLMDSERPAELSASERLEYDMVIEEEAYPFEERAIEVHEENFALLTSAGLYNEWIQKSLDELAVMMPARYAKTELSAGYVGAVDSYAYRMPIVPAIDLSDPDAEAPQRTGDVEPETVEATPVAAAEIADD